MTDRKRTLAWIYCSIFSLIFCFHFYAVKYLLIGGVAPTVLGAIRGIVGGGILAIIYRKGLREKINGYILKRLALIAFFGFFLNQICFMYGLKLSTPLNGAIIVNTIPVVLTLMAIIFSLEHFSWKKIAGVIVGFTSVAILCLDSNNYQISENNIGDLLIFMNVIFFCLAMTVAKKILNEKIPPYLIPVGMLTIGGSLLMMISFWHLPNAISFTFENYTNFGVMLFEVVGSTSITYLLLFKALEVLPPSQNAILSYTQPLIIVGIDYLFLSKVPTIILVPVFLGIILSGYMVITAKKRLYSQD